MCSPFSTSGGRVSLRAIREGEGDFSDRTESLLLSLVNRLLRLLKLNLLEIVLGIWVDPEKGVVSVNRVRNTHRDSLYE